jgi:hypothetical protein
MNFQVAFKKTKGKRHSMKAAISGALSTTAMVVTPHTDVPRALEIAVDEPGLQFLFSAMAGYRDMKTRCDKLSRYDG